VTTGRTRQGRPGWWALSAAYAVGVYAASSIPGGNFVAPLQSDKIVHAIEFGTLAYLVSRASGNALAGLMVGALWGAVDEAHQAFVPLRSADLWDWSFDVFGSTIGAYYGARAARRREEPQTTLVTGRAATAS
jgi:hypothetical protein